jgi:hypothetical protein
MDIILNQDHGLYIKKVKPEKVISTSKIVDSIFSFIEEHRREPENQMASTSVEKGIKDLTLRDEASYFKSSNWESQEDQIKFVRENCKVAKNSNYLEGIFNNIERENETETKKAPKKVLGIQKSGNQVQSTLYFKPNIKKANNENYDSSKLEPKNLELNQKTSIVLN